MDRIKIAIAQLNPSAGDIKSNLAALQRAHGEAAKAGADILVTPECYLSGYQIDDLARVEGFLDVVAAALDEIETLTKTGPAIIVGAPRRGDEGKIYNSVFVYDKGACVGVRDKVRLAGAFFAGVFDDPRNFTPGKMPDPVELCGVKIGVPICEDIWGEEVVAHLKTKGTEMIISPNGSPYEYGKRDVRLDVLRDRVEESGMPFVYINLVGGADDMIYDGGSVAVNTDGGIAAYLPCYEEAIQYIEAERDSDGWKFSGEVHKAPKDEEALWRAITIGLRDYVLKNGFKRVLLGLSGGIDSALTATLAVDALGAENVDAVMMPSPFTSKMSIDCAEALSKNLGIRLRRIDIEDGMQAMDKTLKPAIDGGIRDVAAENIQARLRGVILMAISNSEGQMLITSGNKSEAAVGYATLYGDMCGSYAPLIDCWKTRVYALANWRNANTPPDVLGPDMRDIIPQEIITRPPTAELRAGQKDSDSLPAYDVLDPIMLALEEEMQSPEHVIADGHDEDTVYRLGGMLMDAEFKRRQSPPGPKISARAFSRDRRFPITNHYRPGDGTMYGTRRRAKKA